MPGIVLHFSQSVYWPIPKNACTTLKSHLIRLLDIPCCENNPHWANFEWTDKSIPGYRNWALVRNPYARLHSLWTNKIAEGHPVQSQWKKRKIDPNVFGGWSTGIIWSGMSFEEFAKNILESEIKNSHWDPQTGMLPESCEIVKLENIGSSLKVFLPSLNPSHIKVDWRKAYKDDSVRHLVYNYYKSDFDLLGYSHHLFDTILIDCDGVLTDGFLTIDHKGEKQFKRFHTRDVRAIRELVFNGFRVVIVSVDDWPGIFEFANKVGAEVFISRDKKDLPFQNYVAIGDDCWDVEMLKGAVTAYAPYDCDYSVCQIENINRLNTPGGQGVLAEFAREILK